MVRCLKPAIVALGHSKDASDLVTQYALLAKAAGADGVVCSAQEVTPGIRPEGTDANGQSRIMTLARAMSAASDYLVIGRPITRAADPKEALSEIQLSLENAGV